MLLTGPRAPRVVLPVVFIDLQSPVFFLLLLSSISEYENKKENFLSSSEDICMYVCEYVCVCVCATSLHDDPVEEAFMEKSKGHGPSPCPFFSSFYL
jgi:hypothetical protein